MAGAFALVLFLCPDCDSLPRICKALYAVPVAFLGGFWAVSRCFYWASGAVSGAVPVSRSGMLSGAVWIAENP